MAGYSDRALMLGLQVFDVLATLLVAPMVKRLRKSLPRVAPHRFAFAGSAFLFGFGSIVDLFGTQFRTPPQLGFSEDQERLGRDWAVVGSDLERAARRLRHEQPEEAA